MKREIGKKKRERHAEVSRGLGFAKGGIKKVKCWTWRNTCLVSGI